ncbi:MAG: endonuclease/exonuclease/phosphatase family protein [Winogradskyella sp.]|uniref:endonuclease/exonuclease/phosphatase family protein n=1 Tax=Winogradskyella sp. TaxID=1883156 RepID=UPI0025E4ECC0|nr:endonuclease/exonuclease/phosphatase family protein [Winogradskyella sp.]NRB58894.1 endonuclease/exonuclease/phosphatase family protein [Winogradskyella sp.]
MVRIVTGVMKSKFIKIDYLDIFILLLIFIPSLNLYFNLGFVSVFISVLYPVFFGLAFIIALYSIWKKKYVYGFLIITYFIFSNLNLIESLSTEKDSISILTYNVNAFDHPNNITTDDAPSEIVKFINKTSPDICILQEPTYKEGLKIKGYDYTFLGYRDSIVKSFLTISSKYPIIHQGFVDFPETKNSAIYADIIANGDTLRVYNTHLQSYKLIKDLSVSEIINNLNINYNKQIEQAKILKQHILNTDMPVLICGDFNATAFSLPYRTLKQDMFNSFSNYGYKLGKTYEIFKYPIRIDHVLYNDKIELLKHENFELKFSDHEPIIVEIVIE